MNHKVQKQVNSFLLIFLFFIFFSQFDLVKAAWGGTPYEAGQTLDPECAPTEENCTVLPSTQWTTGDGNISFNNGGVGIGTTTPTQLLDVAGNIHTTGSIYFYDGSHISSAAEAGISQWSNSENTIYYSEGNVGIGTSNASSALTVQGTNSAVSTDGDNLILSNDYDNDWSYSGDWYSNGNSVTHVTDEGQSALSQSLVSTPIAGDYYRVYFRISNRYAGSVRVGVGGQTSNQKFAENGTSYGDYFSTIIQSNGDSEIVFYPTSNFSGTISDVSVYHINRNDPTLKLLNSDGSLGVEIRTGSDGGTINSFFIGNNSGSLSTGFQVIGQGYQAAQYNTGNYVNAIGASAARQNANNYVNAFGSWAARNNTGDRLNAIGESAGNNNSGSNVNAIGSYTAYNNTGNYVNAIGTDAAGMNTGYTVNALGNQAAQYNTGGFVNAIGLGAARYNTGYNVNAIGYAAAEHNSGNSIDALGYYALAGKEGGDSVVGIGSDDSEDGFVRGTQRNIGNSILIGPSSITNVTSYSLAPLTNVIAIGGKVTGSNQAVFGNNDTMQTLLHGNVGIGSTTPTTKLAVEGDKLVNFIKQNGLKTVNSNYFDVAISGNTLYVADYSNGLLTFDITDKNNPKLLSSLGISGNPTRVFVYNKIAFLTAGGYLFSIDVTDPIHPVLKNSFYAGNYIDSLYVANGVAYVGVDNYLRLYDISMMTDESPSDPNYLGQSNLGSRINGITVVNNYAYLALDNGVNIENIEGINPNQSGDPYEVNSYNIGSTWDVAISGNYLYAVTGYNSVFSFDIGDGSEILPLDSVRLDTEWRDHMRIKTMGDYAYIADGEPNSVYALSIVNPKDITFAGYVTTLGKSFGIGVSEDHVYIADFNAGLITFSIEEQNSVIASFTKGNVGIGTNDPKAKLQVAGLGGNDGLKFVTSVKSDNGGSYPGFISGNYLFSRNNNGGIDISDISDPYSPKLISTYFSSIGETGFNNGMVASGNYAYIPDSNDYIEVIDISNKTSPQFVTTINPEVSLYGPQISGHYLFALDSSYGIEVYDISNPASPVFVSTLDSSQNYFGSFKIFGSNMFAVNGFGQVEIYDVSNPYQIDYKSLYGPTYGTVGTLSVIGNIMYMGDYTYTNKLEIADISDITQPAFMSVYASPTGGLTNIVASGHFAFGTNNNGQIEVIDATNPLRPKYVTEFTSNEGGFLAPIISGKYMYVENYSGKIEVIDISNPKAPIAAIFTGGRVGVGTEDPSAAFSVMGAGSDAPQLVSQYSTVHGSLVDNPIISGHYAYVIDSMGRLEIIDVADQKNPSLMATYTSNFGALAYPMVFGDFVYATTESGMVEVIDVSNHSDPLPATTISMFDGSAGRFNKSGNYLYVADSLGYIEVFDVSNLSDISNVQIFEPSVNVNSAYPILIYGNRGYIRNQDNAVSVFTLDAGSMSDVETISPQSGSVSSISIKDNILFISNTSNAVELYDISNSESAYRSTYTPPSSNWTYLDPYSPGADDYVYVGSNCNIYTINVSNPAAPREMDARTPISDCTGGPYVAGGFGYIVGESGVLHVYDIGGVAHPSFAATFSNGRVGVGTNNPLAMFDVAGSMILSGTNRYLNFGYNTGNYGYGIRDNNGTLQYKNYDGDWADMGGGNSPWLTTQGAVYSLSGDNFGIGTITPGEKLHVVGRVAADSFAVGQAIQDYTNNSPWYGIGQSSHTLPDASNPDQTVQVAGYYGMEFVTAGGDMVLTQHGGVGIGTDNPDASAILDLSSTSKAFLPPRMTETQRNAISDPAVGSVLFNTTSNTLQYYAAAVVGYTDGTGNTGTWALHATNAMGQTITPENTGVLNSISGSFATRPSGENPDDLKADVVAKIYDGPNGNLLATSDNVVTDNNTTEFTFVTGTWTFSGAHFTLNSGTQYYIEFTDSDTAPNAFYFGESTGVYSRGEFYTGDHGSVSSVSDYDLDLNVSYGTSLNGGWADVGGGWKTNNNGNIFFNNGNVGIGTTNPTSALEVNGDMRISSGSGGRLYFGDGSSMFTASANGIGIESTNDLNFSTGGQMNFGFGDGLATTTKFVIKNDGSVGIGTDSPNSMLDIYSTEPGQVNMLTISSLFTDNNEGSAIVFKDSDPMVPNYVEAAKIRSIAYAPGVAGLAFDVGNLYGMGGINEAMRISAESGYVGIGNQDPQSALDIMGNITQDQFMLNQKSRLSLKTDGLSFWENNINVDGDYIDEGTRSSWRMYMGDDGSNYNSFGIQTNPRNSSDWGSSYIQPLTILNNGNIGIGSTTPDQMLSVGGSVAVLGDVCTSLTCLNDLAQPSDERLKTNVVSLLGNGVGADTLSNIMKLNPVTYNWNDTYLKINPNAHDATTTKLGFIAQEMNAVFPEAVLHLQNGLLGIDYGKLTSVLTAGIQEIVNISGTFKDSLVSWFGAATNGIKQFFAEEVHTKKICVAKSDGSEVCVTGDELQKMVNVPSQPIVTPSSDIGTTTQADVGESNVTTGEGESADHATSAAEGSQGGTTEGNLSGSNQNSNVEYSNGGSQTTTGNDNAVSAPSQESSGGGSDAGAGASE